MIDFCLEISGYNFNGRNWCGIRHDMNDCKLQMLYLWGIKGVSADS